MGERENQFATHSSEECYQQLSKVVTAAKRALVEKGKAEGRHTVEYYEAMSNLLIIVTQAEGWLAKNPPPGGG